MGNNFLYKNGDIVLCKYFDTESDVYVSVFGFILDRIKNPGQWGIDKDYRILLQKYNRKVWLREDEIIKLIDRIKN
jgi:hypothetical protein